MDGLQRRWERKPLERLIISFALFAIRHIFLACSHESMCLPAASCKLALKEVIESL